MSFEEWASEWAGWARLPLARGGGFEADTVRSPHIPRP